MHFGRELRRLLWERDIAPTRFAEHIGVTAGYLSKLLLHPDRDPSSAVLCRIVFGFANVGHSNALTDAEISGLLRARYLDVDPAAALPNQASLPFVATRSYIA